MSLLTELNSLGVGFYKDVAPIGAGTVADKAVRVPTARSEIRLRKDFGGTSRAPIQANPTESNQIKPAFVPLLRDYGSASQGK